MAENPAENPAKILPKAPRSTLPCYEKAMMIK
jgi:hypothetical protein